MVKYIFEIAIVAWLITGFALPAQSARRVLYIDSYHQGYPWSDGITQAVKSTLEKEDIALRIYHMDTKRNGSEAYKKKSALKVREVITQFGPDVVIASDDNASRYVIMPYYKDDRLPFVFCGVDYTADAYGFPYSNVTGMVELPPATKLIYSLKYFTRIIKVGYLAGDTFAERKDAAFTKRDIREDFVESYVKTFVQWKSEFLRLQDEVDVLIIGNNSGIKGWNDSAAKRFAEDSTRIVTGCFVDKLAPLAFISATRSATEFGEYAAKVALQILDGTSPSSIPITTNVMADIIVNMRIAKKLGKKVPNSIQKIASQIIE
jgi:ABC-type uncharacterized transport system substrate-binding protein